MYVKDILTLSKLRLHNLAVSRDDRALLMLINLAVSELYNRFNLSIKSETVYIDSHRALYDLQNDDVALILGLYSIDGRELKQPDVLNSNQYDYKIVNYKSFMLRKPFDGLLYANYKASPVALEDENDFIDIPDIMTDALLAYIVYMGHTTINRDQANESVVNYQRFEAACNRLDMQGYTIPLNTEKISLHYKGYV